MVLFFVGAAVGCFVCLAALALVDASDADEQRADLCRGCPYEDYSGGLKDCEKCHEAEDVQ